MDTYLYEILGVQNYVQCLLLKNKTGSMLYQINWLKIKNFI